LSGAINVVFHSFSSVCGYVRSTIVAPSIEINLALTVGAKPSLDVGDSFHQYLVAAALVSSLFLHRVPSGMYL